MAFKKVSAKWISHWQLENWHWK